MYFPRVSPPVSTSVPITHPEEWPFEVNGAFQLARMALREGLDLAETFLGGGPVLVPQFICGEALLPFRALGIRTLSFKLDGALQPDFAALERLAKDSCATGLLMVHFFGIPQETSHYQEISHKANLLLIEDNAHGYGGWYQGTRLGSFGDFAVHSPRKSFALPDGGLLEIPRASRLRVLSKNRSSMSVAAVPVVPNPAHPNTLGRKTKDALLMWSVTRSCLADRRIRHFISAQPDNSLSNSLPMSLTSRKLLLSWDNPIWPRIRREQDSIWRRWSKRNSLCAVTTSGRATEAAPLCTPVFVETRNIRDTWLKRLFIAGIDAYPWPLGESQPDLSDRLICLPINPFLPNELLEETLRKL